MNGEPKTIDDLLREYPFPKCDVVCFFYGNRIRVAVRHEQIEVVSGDGQTLSEAFQSAVQKTGWRRFVDALIAERLCTESGYSEMR